MPAQSKSVCHVSLVTRDPALALRASRVAAAPAHPDPLRRLPSVSHAARSPQHETLARSDGLPAVCGGNGVGNGLPCPCDCAMSRRVSGSPSQPTTLQPPKSLLRYRHGIGHFTSSPWSMPANHGAQAHRASPPNTRWRSPPLVFLRARDPRNQPCLTCLCHRLGRGGGSTCAWPRCRPPPGHLHATRLHRRRRRRRGRSATRAYARAGSARNHDTSRRGIIDDHVSSQCCQQGHQGRRCHGL